MANPGDRKLRPLAIVCALLMILWGLASAVALVMHVLNLNDFGWPDEDSPGEVLAYTWLFLVANVIGLFVGVWGLLALKWRPPLHLAALALVVAVAMELVANLVLVNYFKDFDPASSFGNQMEFYLDRVTFDVEAAEAKYETRAFFLALPLVTALLPLVVYLVALFTGAGRKVKQPAYGAAPSAPQHPQSPQAPQHPQSPQAPLTVHRPPPPSTPPAGQRPPAPQQPTYPPPPPPSEPTRRRPPDPPARP
ncbi:hypothetical protein [Nocardioides bizhenqiangii]|uniref:DUF2567 domain-containing protein n=1 Tax=Nocardioides bizhenqiangii TaxID=3095076 RepID=A0ABZ0ZWS0_9ACTN|nr:hypothetical protein [Nocardioides sp. HM61]WQQ28112.1 hypothetical protein SHK19_07735 [Nocardioides sp. HM61]